MRIGILAYLLHDARDYRSAGVATYIRQLIASLPSAAGSHDFVVFHGADATLPSGVKGARVPFPTQNPAVRIGCEQAVIPLEILFRHFDVLHGTVDVIPWAVSTPRVVTLHDLSFLVHPERFRRSRVSYLTAAVKWSVRKARRIICVSETTRRDVSDMLNVQAERIHVIHPGVDGRFTPLSADRVESFRRDQFGDRPYILHVGTLEPRKNLDVLIQAFGRARRKSGIPHLLVLAGAKGWMYEPLFGLVAELGLENDVRFAGFVDPVDLPLWYNAADVFVYPSEYEGFGLPLVEAMASGVPVITSGSGALAEVAGDASVAVEAGSVEDLELAMLRVLDDRGLRDDLRRAGLSRAQNFSWERAARETARVYELAAGTPA